MGRFDFRSPGAAAGDAVAQYFAELAARHRQSTLDGLAVRNAALEQQRIEAALRRQATQDAQQQADREAATRQATNDRGYRDMMATGQQQLRGTTDPVQQRQLAAQLEAMATREGAPVPGVVAAAMQPPEDEPFIYITTPGPDGQPMRRGFTRAQVQSGVEEYREPRQQPTPAKPDYEWVIGRDGQPRQIVKGQTRPGDRPYNGGASQSTGEGNSRSGTVLDALDDLSQRINSEEGIAAKVSGTWKSAAARANYNDDVAEYEAIANGAVPLVARAMGHTGVLTQMDVDSVKAMFPRPGDSKALRDRKMARLRSLMGMGGGQSSGFSADTLRPMPAHTSDWITVAPGVRIREKR